MNLKQLLGKLKGLFKRKEWVAVKPETDGNWRRYELGKILKKSNCTWGDEVPYKIVSFQDLKEMERDLGCVKVPKNWDKYSNEMFLIIKPNKSEVITHDNEFKIPKEME